MPASVVSLVERVDSRTVCKRGCHTLHMRSHLALGNPAPGHTREGIVEDSMGYTPKGTWLLRVM